MSSSFDAYEQEPVPTPPKKRSGLPAWAWVLIILFVVGPIGLVGLSIVAAIAIPSLVAARLEANEKKIVADLEEITVALESYQEIHGDFPSNLAVLARPDESGMAYLSGGELPTDPFGRDYLYAPAGTFDEVPIVYTLGNDQAPGGELVDADYDNSTMYR